MAQDNLVREKAKHFALRIVKMCKYIEAEKHERVMSRQLLRSGTSIGANISEALHGISRKDFLAKMFVALKESAETNYWIELMHEAEYIDDAQFESIYADSVEMFKLLHSICKSTRKES